MKTPRHDPAASAGPLAPLVRLARISRAWAAWRGARMQPAPLVEELEARLMYAADPAGAGLALAGAVIEQRLVDDGGEFIRSTSVEQRSRELLIVGAGIADSRTLLDGLARDGRDIEVLELDPAQDGLDQIGAALAGRDDLAAIHILSHGASGELQLGADTLDAATLAARAGEIGRWGDALRAGGDILLYGCDVAAGDAGAAFVRQLAALTGADVAASDDLTGDSALQGDWTLEFATGQIDSATAFSAAGAQWRGTLEIRVNAVSQDKQQETAVAVSPSGSFVVTWTADHDQDGDNTGVFAQRFNASGNPVGAQIRVNTVTQDRQEASSVGIAADGSFVVAWASHSQQGGDTDGWSIRAQRFAADGSKAGAEFVVNQLTAKDQSQPSLAVAADGQFVVAWATTADDDIHVRHFDAAGNPLRGEVKANGVNGSGNQVLPSVAIAADGSYVVVWQTDSGGTGKSVYAQRFNADDSLRGSGFRVNTQDADDQTQPSVAVGGTGAFVIAWTSAKQDGDNGGIYAQRYGADGAPAGSEFRVNNVTNKDQIHASVAMDGAGNFTIAWDSTHEDNGNSSSVHARRYDAGGAALGGAFLVNSTTSGHQEAPATAMNGNGTLVIAWEGAGIGDSDGVFAALYQAANTPPIARADAVSLAHGDQASSAAPGVLANDADADSGATLAVAALLSATDGSVLAVTAGGASMAGVYGTLSIQADGSYVYSADSSAARALAAGQTGSDVFTYVVRDDNNADASSTLTFIVTGINDAPTAGNDAYAVEQYGSLSIDPGVLANDADADRNPADTLTVVSINSSPGTVGSDVTGNYGTLRVDADGALTYVPDSLSATLLALLALGPATDSFTYQISDGRGGVGSATISITILASNAAPVASSDSGPDYTLQQDGSLTVSAARGVLANDTDPDSNTLNAQVVSGPAHGNLQLNADGSLTYTPDANYHGTDSFVYRASDGSLESLDTIVTLTILHVNHAPSAADDSASATAGGSSIADAVNGLLANDGDIDSGDQFAITSVQYRDQVITLAQGVDAVLTTDFGTLYVGSDGAYRFVADGAAGMRLGPGAVSGENIGYTISDGDGATSTARLSLDITGVNDAPAITVVTAGAGAAPTVSDQRTLQPFTGVTIADVDSPAQQLVVQIALDDQSKGVLVATRGGSYDAARGIYTFTGTAAEATAAVSALVFVPTANRLAPGQVDITRFTITADDGTAIASDAGITVASVSVNDAPVIIGITPAQAVDDTGALNPFAGVSITDADADADADADGAAQQLTVRVTLDNPALGTFSGAGGIHDPARGVYLFTGTAGQASDALRNLVFTPAANRVSPGVSETALLTLTVDDGQAGASVVSRLSVTSVEDAPVLTLAASTLTMNDDASLAPFAGMTVADADSPAQQLTLRITLDDPVKGSLSGAAGTYDAAAGVYTMSGTAAQLNAAVRTLQFAPVENRVAPGQAETVTFSLTVSDGMQDAGGAVAVKSVSVNDPPSALDVSARGAQDSALAILLAASDADAGAIDLLIASAPANGTLYLDAARLSPLLPGARLALVGSTVQVYFVPEAGWHGDTGFSYAAIDAEGLAGVSAAVGIVVAPGLQNVAPTPMTPTVVAPTPMTPSTVTPTPVAPTTVTPATATPTTVPDTTVVRTEAAAPAVQTADARAAPAAEREETAAEGAAPRPALLAGIIAVATPDGQLGEAASAPEPALPASTNQPPTAVAAPVRSSAERAPQAYATMLAAAAMPEAGAAALLAAELDAAQVLADASIERASAAARNETLASSLDRIQDTFKQADEAEQRVVGSSVAVGAGVSVGYVIWLLRGGVLATSLLSSLPAWRFVDPLPVLARMRQSDDEDDSDDSLESLVAGDDGPEGRQSQGGHAGHDSGRLQSSGSAP